MSRRLTFSVLLLCVLAAPASAAPAAPGSVDPVPAPAPRPPAATVPAPPPAAVTPPASPAPAVASPPVSPPASAPAATSPAAAPPAASRKPPRSRPHHRPPPKAPPQTPSRKPRSRPGANKRGTAIITATGPMARSSSRIRASGGRSTRTGIAITAIRAATPITGAITGRSSSSAGNSAISGNFSGRNNSCSCGVISRGAAMEENACPEYLVGIAAVSLIGLAAMPLHGDRSRAANRRLDQFDCSIRRAKFAAPRLAPSAPCVPSLLWPAPLLRPALWLLRKPVSFLLRPSVRLRLSPAGRRPRPRSVRLPGVLAERASATRARRRTCPRSRRPPPSRARRDACGPCSPAGLRNCGSRSRRNARRARACPGFIARHIEQPGSRQSKPAAMKILSRPFGLGLLLHDAGAGHDHRVDARVDLLAFGDPRDFAQILDAAVGA